MWSAEFTIWQANGFAAKQDAFNSMGCFTRAAKNIVTALFAINEMYPLGDKRAIEILDHATIKPENFASKIDEILCCNKQRLADNVMLLRQLFDQTEALAGGAYKPYYKL